MIKNVCAVLGQARAFSGSVQVAFQFLYIYSTFFADRAIRLLRVIAISAGEGGDGMAGFGVVLFLWLLGRPLCTAPFRIDLLELLVRKEARKRFMQAFLVDGGHYRKYCVA